MAESAQLNVQTREKLGSRSARALRAEGRIPANLQSKGEPHLDFSIDERDFLATRRRHVHLYDLDFGGGTESAVVRELQWDTFGERILHVEFKRVQLGVETETEVALSFTGKPLGVVNQMAHHVAVLSIPSLIPDDLEVKVGGLEIGTTLKASDIELPEGVRLAIDPDTDIASIIGTSALAAEEDVAEEPEEPAAEESEPEAGEE